MSTLLKFASGTLILLTLACDPCAKLDCISSDIDGNFSIVSKADGKDLVFGPDKIYNRDSILFFAVNGVDTVRYPQTGEPVVETPGDSILRVFFFPTNLTVYMRLSDGDIDTLTLTTESFDTDCCGRITNIKNFRLNNSVDIPGDQPVHEIRK